MKITHTNLIVVSRLFLFMSLMWPLRICAENDYTFYSPLQKYGVCLVLSNISNHFVYDSHLTTNEVSTYVGYYDSFKDRIKLEFKTCSVDDTCFVVSQNDWHYIVLLKHPHKDGILWMVNENKGRFEYTGTFYDIKNINKIYKKESEKNFPFPIKRKSKKIKFDFEMEKKEFLKYQDRFQP